MTGPIQNAAPGTHVTTAEQVTAHVQNQHSITVELPPGTPMRKVVGLHPDWDLVEISGVENVDDGRYLVYVGSNFSWEQ